MRKILATLILFFSVITVTAQDFKPTNEDYDTSESMVKASVTRTKYYIQDSFFNISITSQEFLKDANRDKPTVIYLHGCSYDNLAAERALLKFYLELGFNYAATDLIKRGDATKSCEVVNGALVVRANGMKRLPARVLELNVHIDWLRENGFKKIYVVGYSEGGLVIQRMQKTVDAAIIHAMSCLTLHPDAKRPTNQNKYLC